MKRDMNEAAQWRDLLHKKDREIEALHRQIDWLTQQLRRLNGRVYGRSSERSAELQEQLCLFEASSHETVRETPSEASVLCRRKKRCGKREADFSNLPVEQILHELPQEQRRCPQCGGELHACGHSVLRRELTYIPAQYKLTEHIQTAYSCRQCEKEEAGVPMKKCIVPPALLPGSGIVSASLLAQIMHSKYVLALPLYRQEQELRRLGLPVSRQTMSNWVLNAGERWLLPVYHALHKELLANKILHADETTLMVLREPDWISAADCLRWRQSFRSKRFRRNSDMRSGSRSPSQLPRNFFGGRKRNTRKILCQRVSMAQRLAMPCGSRAG